MKLKQYLMNSAKSGLSLNRLLNLSLISVLLCGCTYSTNPTFSKENIPQAISDIAKKEYKIDRLTVKLIGETIWLYMPVENILEKAEKPEKYQERFFINHTNVDYKDRLLKIEYKIKAIPEAEKNQDLTYNKKILEKMNGLLSIVRRVLFSMNREGTTEIVFIYVVVADTKTGIELTQISYYPDLKKFSYNLLSMEEFQHRTIQEANLSPKVIGDQTGAYLDFHNETLEDFIIKQIQYRIKLKFQKPEVAKNADIDKEITRVAAFTFQAYGIKDFDGAELINLYTNNRISFNEAALYATIND